jgi:uncharacterized protein (DUF697 family)
MAAQATMADRPVPTKQEETTAPTREEQGNRIIRQNVVWAIGGGVLPFPIFDMVAITVIELKMLKELGDLYEVPFKEDQVKSILVSLVTGLGAPTLGLAATLSVFKAAPVVGYVSAVLSVPVLAAAFTYAVGKIFLQHFASGGTFLDFDPSKVRDHFRREFEEGKLVAAKTKSEVAAPKAS